MRRFLALPLLLLIPLFAGAADYAPISTSTAPNSYLANTQISIHSPVPADLLAAGGTVNIAAPVAGDAMVAGGTVSLTQGAGGDVRVAGLRVSLNGPVSGDIAAAGGTLRIQSPAHTVYAVGGSVDDEGGATGDVTIYGANVFLSGEYGGNVKVVASNRLTLGSNTHIHGTLTYSAPERLTVPSGAALDGGAQYTGAYSYLPTSKEAHRYAIIGTILFFAVRVLAGIIVAGLIAGFFPYVSVRVSRMILRRNPYELAKLLLIGIALAVLTPLVCLFLLISFVGAGLALLLIILYALLIVLSYAFCGIVVGAFLRYALLYKLRGERELTWQDAVLGTLVIHAVGLIPLLGTIAVAALALMCAGALAHLAYRTAFARV